MLELEIERRARALVPRLALRVLFQLGGRLPPAQRKRPRAMLDPGRGAPRQLQPAGAPGPADRLPTTDTTTTPPADVPLETWEPTAIPPLELGAPLPSPANHPTAADLVDDDAGDVEIACLQLVRERGGRTLAARTLSRPERRAAALTVYPDVERPRTRGDCIDGPRPCPWVGCAHHLYLDVNPETGSIKFNHPELAPWELKESCALDVADRGPLILDAIAELLEVTRQQANNIEAAALQKIRATCADLVAELRRVA